MRALRTWVITAVSFLSLALPGFAGELDDFYLKACAARPGSALERAVLSAAAGTGERAHCGTPLKHGLSRDWNKLEGATRKLLALQLVPPVLPESLTSAQGHFTIHYATTGADAPDLAGINRHTGLELSGAAQWASRVAESFETAYAYYQGLGYHMPPTSSYDVYLVSLAALGEYGETDDLQRVSSPGYAFASSSFIKIDKDFTDAIFQPRIFTPLQSLQLTSAHEFHHAIQYGYNFYFDIWYAEVTSTWMEDELYDSVNQLYSYLPSYLPETDTVSLNGPKGNNSEYGRWIFNRYLAERHNTVFVVRSMWEKLAGLNPAGNPVTGGGDIQMAPVLDSVLAASYNSTLSADFLGFAKRIYTRDWNSHVADLGLIPAYTPAARYLSYPVRATAVTLPQYSFAYYKFTPSSGAPNLTISLSKTSGIQTAVFKSQGGAVSEIAADPAGSSYTVTGFGALDPANDEAVLLIANVSGVDNHNANFSTDGNTQDSQEPPSTSTGKSGGCFIATAAYGSYLHPKVAKLRSFRDRRLLTNAPGRLFVSLYYRLSPPLARVIGEHEWLRGAVRGLLVPLILSVEHPAGALALLSLSGGGLAWRLARRRCAVHRPATASSGGVA